MNHVNDSRLVVLQCGLLLLDLAKTSSHASSAHWHYVEVIMSTMASQITSLTIVCLNYCPGAHQRKHQSSALMAFMWGIHRWPVNSSHKSPETRKMFPSDDVIMTLQNPTIAPMPLTLTWWYQVKWSHNKPTLPNYAKPRDIFRGFNIHALKLSTTPGFFHELVNKKLEQIWHLHYIIAKAVLNN